MGNLLGVGGAQDQWGLDWWTWSGGPTGGSGWLDWRNGSRR